MDARKNTTGSSSGVGPSAQNLTFSVCKALQHDRSDCPRTHCPVPILGTPFTPIRLCMS